MGVAPIRAWISRVKYLIFFFMFAEKDGFLARVWGSNSQVNKNETEKKPHLCSHAFGWWGQDETPDATNITDVFCNSGSQIVPTSVLFF